MEEINRSGANGGACHAQMYIMGTLLRHGSEEQKQQWLPPIASGDLRLQAFGVTEPDAGLDTTRIRTRARRDGDTLRGQRPEDLDLARARERPDAAAGPHRGARGRAAALVGAVDVPGRPARGVGAEQLRIQPIETMLNHNTTEVFIDDLEIPAANRIGEEGMGFRYILDGMNAERILIAAECVGDGRWFVERASNHAKQRVGVRSPDRPEPGRGVPDRLGPRPDRGGRPDAPARVGPLRARRECAAEANMAKLLAADASWEAANACLDTHGGFGFAREFDVERKFRETRLYQVAPGDDEHDPVVPGPERTGTAALLLINVRSELATRRRAVPRATCSYRYGSGSAGACRISARGRVAVAGLDRLEDRPVIVVDPARRSGAREPRG